MDADNTLHVYAQYAHHDNAYLAGTAHALTLLKDRLIEALEKGTSVLETYTNNGEGYALNIHVLPDTAFTDLPAPYTAEWLQPATPE